MNSTNLKSMFGKVLTVGLLAGAAVLATPSKANAQVSFGIHVGNAGYAAPYYGRPVVVQPVPAYGYYDRDDWARRQAYAQHEAWERQQAYARHEAWEHQQEYARHEDRERDHEYEEHGGYGRGR